MDQQNKTFHELPDYKDLIRNEERRKVIYNFIDRIPAVIGYLIFLSIMVCVICFIVIFSYTAANYHQ